MQSHYITLPQGRIHCYRTGRGPGLLIALHGFGDSAALFFPFELYADRFRLYAVDLPYHGRSEWKADSYDAGDIEAIITSILEKENRSRFTWLGFSFGGRIVLSMLEHFAGRLERAWLIAPDGLGTRGMAYPQLVPQFLRRFWIRRLDRPQWLLKLAARLHRLRLLDTFSLRFLQFFLRDESRRRCLLNTWLSLDNFQVNLPGLRRVLKQLSLPLTFVLGEKDPLIPLPKVQQLTKELKGVELLVLPRDHDHLIDADLARRVSEEMNNQENDGTEKQRK